MTCLSRALGDCVTKSKCVTKTPDSPSIRPPSRFTCSLAGVRPSGDGVCVCRCTAYTLQTVCIPCADYFNQLMQIGDNNEMATNSLSLSPCRCLHAYSTSSHRPHCFLPEPIHPCTPCSPLPTCSQMKQTSPDFHSSAYK